MQPPTPSVNASAITVPAINQNALPPHMAGLPINIVIEGLCTTGIVLEQVLRYCATTYGLGPVRSMSPQDLHPDQRFNSLTLFVRCASTESRKKMALWQQAECPYLYYIDDNFWDMPTSINGGDLANHIPGFWNNLTLALQQAHHILTPSAVLKRYLQTQRGIAHSISVVPYGIESHHLAPMPKVRLSSEAIAVGFAGTFRQAEFETLIFPALQQLLTEQPEVASPEALRLAVMLVSEGEFAAYHKTLATFPQLVDRITLLEGHTDFATYIKRLQACQWDIGLSPLIETPFTRCKSAIKWLDYSACAMAGLYSRTPPYRDEVTQGETGWLVENTVEAWVEGLTRLLQQPGLRQHIRTQAWQQVKDTRMFAHIAPHWVAALSTIAPAPRWPGHGLWRKTTRELQRLGKKLTP
jgi:glycosyltransferase involved in cell wall biosynthesis